MASVGINMVFRHGFYLIDLLQHACFNNVSTPYN